MTFNVALNDLCQAHHHHLITTPLKAIGISRSQIDSRPYLPQSQYLWELLFILIRLMLRKGIGIATGECQASYLLARSPRFLGVLRLCAQLGRWQDRRSRADK